MIGLNDDIASRWGPRLGVLMNQLTAAVKGALKNPNSGSNRVSFQSAYETSVAIVAATTFVALVVAIVCGLVIGPVSFGTWRVVGDVFSHVGLGHTTLTPLQSLIIWQVRAPRMVLGLLAGAMLAVAGGTYQGVFRNPLADPYLLGVASGAGLGATFAIIDISHGVATPSWTPLLAFAGALGAVTVTWLIGGRSMRSNTATLILAGVAVASLPDECPDVLATAVECPIDHVGLPLAPGFARERRLELCLAGPSLRDCLHHHLRRVRSSAGRHERGRRGVALARRARATRALHRDRGLVARHCGRGVGRRAHRVSSASSFRTSCASRWHVLSKDLARSR